MRKRAITMIVIVTFVIATVVIGAVSTKLAVISFGVDGENQSRYTLYGFYDKSTTEYDGGNSYYLRLDHGRGSFDGWYLGSNGRTYNFTGTFRIDGNYISGTWQIGYVTGWISGKLGS